MVINKPAYQSFFCSYALEYISRCDVTASQIKNPLNRLFVCLFAVAFGCPMSVGEQASFL